MNVEAILVAIPPLAVYLTVGFIIGLESLGIPLPGEVALVTAALLSTRDNLDISPQWVAVAAITGAIIGDSIGYSIGRRFGMPLFERLGRRFPKHFGTGHVALAKQLFARWGVGAVFFGRFIALLRILAGPLAGALHMRYPYFLAANASGAVFWAGGTTAVVYFLGLAAEKWLARFSWVALVAALIIGVTMTLLLKERTRSLIAQLEAEHDWESLRQVR
ncbi:DedA family protein [Mycolicibacterium sp.]|uniref:DedA family protein n=1 Tax=Mycolicibacterium sp. TaxID=2320850 RepID=UPI001DE12805|nr:DedA family protein [Mycolicibacterium sp.]MCB1290846.1 DedA family protein [Mycobacterium sp.]MCB9409078.1 DedA family protein [Mycolicibacterium sp.]